jgi:hypothetical protein
VAVIAKTINYSSTTSDNHRAYTISSVMGQAETGTKDEQILEHGFIFMGRIDRGGEYKAGRGNEPERGVGCPAAHWQLPAAG